MVIIFIDYDLKAFNLNQMINSARTNKYGSAANKKRLMNDLYYLIKPYIEQPLLGVYEVYAFWRVPNKNRDLDNLMLKAIFDCMQQNKWLKNDNLNHIETLHHYHKVTDKTGVDIIFKEVNRAD